MNPPAHTPRPIRAYQVADGSWPIRSDDGHLVALVAASAYEATAKADAEHLAHCWNTHAALLSALEAQEEAEEIRREITHYFEMRAAVGAHQHITPEMEKHGADLIARGMAADEKAKALRTTALAAAKAQG